MLISVTLLICKLPSVLGRKVWIFFFFSFGGDNTIACSILLLGFGTSKVFRITPQWNS